MARDGSTLGMKLKHALRLESPYSAPGASQTAIPGRAAVGHHGSGGQFRTIAFVGAGGKTTSMFRLARELGGRVLVTATTHLGAWQVPMADEHLVAGAHDLERLLKSSSANVVLVTGAVEGDRTLPVPESVLTQLHALSEQTNTPLLVEADGARQRPLKAPAAHEPAVPAFANLVICVAGLSALGRPISAAFIHRPELFAELAGASIGDEITPDVVSRVLIHRLGGLKGIPESARRVVLLAEADSEPVQAAAGGMGPGILKAFDSVAVCSFGARQVAAAQGSAPARPGDPSGPVTAIFERVAGIVLAAGASTRFGRPKQLLDWRGQAFVRAVCQAALAAGLDPVIVVTGADADEVTAAVRGMPVLIVNNPDWASGQASSVRAGVKALSWGPAEPASRTRPHIGAAVFLLADQPQLQESLLRALVERHAAGLYPVVAPFVDADRRANPVLFDSATANALLALTGDQGGRRILSSFPVERLDWHDESMLFDVDSPEDYRRLLDSTGG